MSDGRETIRIQPGATPAPDTGRETVKIDPGAIPPPPGASPGAVGASPGAAGPASTGPAGTGPAPAPAPGSAGAAAGMRDRAEPGAPIFTRLGWFAVRRRRAVLLGTVVFIIAAAVLGTGTFARLKTAGFQDPGAESSKAQNTLSQVFGAGDPNVVALVKVTSGSVDDAAVAAAGRQVTARLAGIARVTQVASYWSLGNAPPLRSRDSTEAIVVARVTGSDSQMTDTYKVIKNTVGGSQGPITVRFGGDLAVGSDLGTQIGADLGKAEGISAPLTVILLIIVFGGLVAAGLPLLVALIAVFGTLLALFVISQVTDVSIYSINLTTALGLGLAIDYSLFIVNRFREELRGGLAPNQAVVRTVETAGRTVAFSALTVAASLSALLVFPLYFLRSFAYAGSSVVVIAALGAVISLPALLAVTGTRVNSLRVWRREPKAVGEGFWHRLAVAVMRRPVIFGGAAILFLVVLGLPFLRVNFGLSGAEALPANAQSRAVSQRLLQDFNGDSSNTFAIVINGIGSPQARASQLADLATRVSALANVSRVDGLTGTYQGGHLVTPPGPQAMSFSRPTGTWLTVVPSVDQVSNAGQTLVSQIRSLQAPFPFGVEGQGAILTDTKAAIFSRLPFAFGIIAAITFVLLFLVFNSLLVPIKAIALNLLSLTATFGAMVWIFQDGHLSGPLNFTATGSLNVTMPILMFCIAFGLSMDYEVFLLSRIKEEHDLTHDNTHSVAVGLERTGRIVTAAAALLAVTFLAFGTSGISFIEMFGLGLALAVVMDATLIRGVLVPAFMRLAGEANWWAPAWMRRIHDRFGISEGAPPPPVPAAAAPSA
jgi:RND superfamily putative drug exporter